MKSFIKHRKIVESLVALLFLVASSGFTMVLHSCLMDEMTCCSRTMTSNHMGTNSTSTDLLVLLVQPVGMTCCESQVVGGLNSAPAVTEKLLQTEHQKVVLLSADAVFASSLIDQSTPSNLNLSSCKAAPSPPVKRYVLTGSFLI